MPKPPMTRVPNMELYKSATSKSTGLFLQGQTTAQIAALAAPPTGDVQLVSNSTLGSLQVKKSDGTTYPVGAIVGLPGAIEVAANQYIGFEYFDNTNAAAVVKKYWNGTAFRAFALA